MPALQDLWKFAAVAARVLEEGEEVGHVEQSAHGLVDVDKFEFAAAGAAVDVESGEGTEAGGVHVLDLLHVDEDAFGGGKEIADFVAELRRVFEGEFAVAFDDGGVFDAVGVEVEGGREAVGLRRRRKLGRVGQGVAPLKDGMGQDYSELRVGCEFLRVARTIELCTKTCTACRAPTGRI
jgi:hypothetical protein